MLSDEEKQEIEAEFSLYTEKEAASIDALKVIQRHRGWVSDEALLDLAQFMEMTPAELDAVATFYNLIFREPVGRHVILVCNSVTCWAMGYERIRAGLADRLGVDLGGTTADGRFTLLPVACLGACEQAPVMMIDDDLHGNLDAARIDAILEHYP